MEYINDATKIKRLQQSNNELIKQVNQMGGDLDPLAYVQIQLQAMCELLFVDVEPLEILYQQKLNEVLTAAIKQAREVRVMIDEQQKKLVKPAKPRLIKPGEN